MILSILKEVLSNINKRTVYKDESYWIYYEAIENFLYGELELCDEGIYWGIKNFASIWEEMCQSYAWSHFKNEIGYADTNIQINGIAIGNFQLDFKKIYVKQGLDYIFNFSFQNKIKYLRPDLVYGDFFYFNCIDDFFKYRLGVEINIKKTTFNLIDFTIINKEDLDVKSKFEYIFDYFKSKFNRIKPHRKDNIAKWKGVTKKDVDNNIKKFFFRHIAKTAEINKTTAIKIVDFKYHSLCDFIEDTINNKIKNDVKKQLIYELTISQYVQSKSSNVLELKSYFIIPKYKEYNTNPNDPLTVYSNKTNTKIKDAEIEIQLADFIEFQKTYLEI